MSGMNQRIVFAIALVSLLSCGRKDVHRDGTIRLRGERPIALKGVKKGDLLQTGIASWYGPQFHGRQTASGERFDMDAMTAAHKSLPFGALVTVVNQDNGKQAVVRINDRGPFVKDRIIDLSREAARRLGVIGPGTAHVKLYLDHRPERFVSETSEPGWWSVQAGSFSSFDRARALYVRLEAYGAPVVITRFDGLYRVRAGRFVTQAEAVALCDHLKRDQVDCWIVRVSK